MSWTVGRSKTPRFSRVPTFPSHKLRPRKSLFRVASLGTRVASLGTLLFLRQPGQRGWEGLQPQVVPKGQLREQDCVWSGSWVLPFAGSWWIASSGLWRGCLGGPCGVSTLLTFGVTVLEGDCSLMLGSEASTTGEAQGPSCFRLIGATWAWLAGLKPVY